MTFPCPHWRLHGPQRGRHASESGRCQFPTDPWALRPGSRVGCTLTQLCPLDGLPRLSLSAEVIEGLSLASSEIVPSRQPRVSQEGVFVWCCGPGQPFSCAWEHAVLSLLAPVLEHTVCYSNRHRNPDHTPPVSRSVMRTCEINAYNQEQAAHWNAKGVSDSWPWNTGPFTLIPDPTHFGRRATARRWEKQITVMMPAWSLCHT